MVIGQVQGSVEATLLILVAIILVGPLVAERFKVPGLLGLILGGMIVGPFVLDWVPIDGLMSDLGAIGLLYLMFLAGLSFDLKSFSENRASAIVFGLLGFTVPFLLSLFVAMRLLDYDFLAALLIGAMWASNTLVAYPDAYAAGLATNRAVGTAVSAGVIADVLSLTVLAFVSSAEVLESDSATASNPDPAMPLWLGMLLLVVFTLVLLPLLTKWFFVKVGHTRTQRFLFVLAGMAAGGVVALLGGMEGLIGAFLAGLGMNRLIPSRGPLMDRVEFFGAALFIPAFLVSIGLSVDPAALFDLETLGLGLTFTGLVVGGKLTAALIVGRMYRLSFNEVGIMSSLSMGQAASTLAIAQVGISLGLFDQQVVNAAILAIVATALVTSYGTRYFAKRIERPVQLEKPLGETVIVDARAEGAELEGLLRLADAIAEPDDGLVVPYAVAPAGDKALARARVDAAVDTAERLGMDTEGETRIGESFPAGTLGLVEELDASLLLLRWPGPSFPTDYVFGTEIDNVGRMSSGPAVAAHILGSWNRLVVATGDLDTAWRAEDVDLTLDLARRVQEVSKVKALIFSPAADELEEQLAGFENAKVISTQDRGSVIDALQPDDLLIIPSRVAQRANTLLQRRLARRLAGISMAIVGGPGRLTVSAGVVRRQVQGVVGTTR